MSYAPGDWVPDNDGMPTWQKYLIAICCTFGIILLVLIFNGCDHKTDVFVPPTVDDVSSNDDDVSSDSDSSSDDESDDE